MPKAGTNAKVRVHNKTLPALLLAPENLYKSTGQFLGLDILATNMLFMNIVHLMYSEKLAQQCPSCGI